MELTNATGTGTWDFVKTLPKEQMWIAVVVGLAFFVLCLCVMGILTHKLARKKGYRGYFWTGFFLQLVGLIYVVGLPDRHRRRHSSSDE